MASPQLADIVVALKKQVAKGTAASGAGATGLEVLQSSGLSKQIAQIESQIIQATRMRKKPRHGSISAAAQYETELSVSNLDDFLPPILGASDWTATFDIDESDVTSLAISGTGTTITAASGSFISLGVRSGMMGKLASMTTSANNGKWFPITTAAASTLTVPSGFLTDETADSACTLTIAKYTHTPAAYVDSYWTVEEYLGSSFDRSKLGTDMKFHALNLSIGPDAPTRVGVGLTGLDVEFKSTGDSPVFSSPTFVNEQSLYLVDGGLYVNGTKVTTLTGATFGLVAPATTPALIGQRKSNDVYLGQFALTGEFTGIVEDATDFDALTAETNISVLLHCAERESDPASFVTFYFGSLCYGGYQTGVGGDGPVIKTVPLYGGEDERGTGYAQTAVLISSSAA